MNLEQIGAGKKMPEEINVVIEIPSFGGPIKYEVDKDSGALMVDRFMGTAMYYPCNYGFVPCTLSDDGDPVDVLVITPVPLQTASVVSCRPIGVLKMTDESGEDAKIVAVPVSKLTPLYENVHEIGDLPESTRLSITHFFEQYKANEKGKWVKIEGWEDAASAKAEVQASFDRAQQSK